jgi:hypothetical protein
MVTTMKKQLNSLYGTEVDTGFSIERGAISLGYRHYLPTSWKAALGLFRDYIASGKEERVKFGFSHNKKQTISYLVWKKGKLSIEKPDIFPENANCKEDLEVEACLSYLPPNTCIDPALFIGTLTRFCADKSLKYLRIYTDASATQILHLRKGSGNTLVISIKPAKAS